MWLPLIFLLFSSVGLAAEVGGKVYRWPAGYEGKQKLAVKKLDVPGEGRVGFETENFRFFADTAIPNKDWRSIMIVCEGLRGAAMIGSTRFCKRMRTERMASSLPAIG